MKDTLAVLRPVLRPEQSCVKAIELRKVRAANPRSVPAIRWRHLQVPHSTDSIRTEVNIAIRFPSEHTNLHSAHGCQRERERESNRGETHHSPLGLARACRGR